VISPVEYTWKVGLALFCPITSKVMGYPFEIVLPAGLPISGVVSADQVESLDRRARNARKICTLPSETLAEVIEKVSLLIET